MSPEIGRRLGFLTVLMQWCGALQPKVRAILKAYLIGEVAAPDQTSLLKDWNAMRKDFEARGLMDASALFYGRKLFELIAMISTAAWLNFTYPTSVLAMLASAFLAATYLYQCGWTQHDFQHNQVRVFVLLFPSVA